MPDIAIITGASRGIGAATAKLAARKGFAVCINHRDSATQAQDIADPADIAATAGVGFTINHIAAVVIPAAFGLLWLVSPAAVFLSGTVMAIFSLLLSLNVPAAPAPGNEVVGRLRPVPITD